MELPLNPLRFLLIDPSGQNRIDTSRVINQALPGQPNVQCLLHRPSADALETLYWQLPNEFTGNRLASYGGLLRYTVYFEQPINDYVTIARHPDLVFQGERQRLIVRHKGLIRPSEPNRLEVRLTENNFLDDQGQPIDRAQLLQVLSRLRQVLIKASYSREATVVALAQLSLDIESNELDQLAALQPQWFGRQAAPSSVSRLTVEKCTCPPGHSGRSCESCSAGFFRQRSAADQFGRCVACECNGNSADCDPESGRCRRCLFNSDGDRCERCAAGYAKSESRGFPECVALDGGEETRNEKFISLGSQCGCDPRGTSSSVCSPATGSRSTCTCKANVEGERCDRCKAGHFYLSSLNRDGCQSCFCFNATRICRESSLYSTDLRAHLDQPDQQPTITDRFSRRDFSRFVRFTNDELVFSMDNQLNNITLYWSLPAEFLGDQLSSYGSDLTFVQRYTFDKNAAEFEYFEDSNVEITGGNLLLFYVGPIPHRVGDQIKSRVPLKEGNWQVSRLSSPHFVSAATRADMLQALSDVQKIHIRAKLYSNATAFMLRSVSMGSGQVHPPFAGSSTSLATQVEQCFCPPGYAGRSCQSCQIGFARKNGKCVRCSCNGHSDTCEPETLTCAACKHNTAGESCERCTDGFYGSATGATVNDCSPCPCPLTSNGFTPTCFRESDGKPTCSSCPTGYTGRNCERCAAGYQGNPLQPGDLCRPLNATITPTSATATAGNDDNIRVQLQPEQIQVQIGHPVRLRCAVYGSNEASSLPIVWSRAHGHSLPNNTRKIANMLEFVPSSDKDAGEYYCRVPLLSGKPIIASSTVLIQQFASTDPQSPQIRVDPRSAIVRAGDSVTLRCYAYGHPKPTIHWMRSVDGQLMPESRVEQDALTIARVAQSDTGDYYCVAENRLGKEQIRTYVYVKPSSESDEPETRERPETRESIDNGLKGEPTVNGGASDVISAPTVRMSPDRQMLVQGKDGQIECIGNGQPAPRLTWLRARADLPAAHRIVDTSSSLNQSRSILYLHSAQIDYRGLYVCRGENAGGLAQASAVVEIERREIPAIDIYPYANQSIPLHSSALFQCRLTAGTPSPVVTWRRLDDTPLPPSITPEEQERAQSLAVPQALAPLQVFTNGVLRFNRVLPEHAGRYVCNAENVAGRVTAEAVLQIVGQPHLSIRQSTPYRVRLSDPIRLDCELTLPNVGQSAQYQVTWRKLVPDSAAGSYVNVQVPSARELPNRALIHMNTANADDAGFYVCSAVSAGDGRTVAMQRIQVLIDDDLRSGSSDSPSEPEVHVQERVVNVPQSSNTEMRCFVHNSAKPLRLNWLRVGGHLPAHWKVADGVLFANNVTLEDAGQYVCHVHDADNNKIVVSQKVLLVVKGEFNRFLDLLFFF
jgi:hypothetical protein